MAYCHLKGCPIFENGSYSSSEIRNWNGMCCTLAHGWGTKFLQTTIILRAYLSHAFCLISQKILIHITQWFLLPAAASFECWKQWLKICSVICIFKIFSLHLFFSITYHQRNSGHAVLHLPGPLLKPVLTSYWMLLCIWQVPQRNWRTGQKSGLSLPNNCSPYVEWHQNFHLRIVECDFAYDHLTIDLK